MSPVASPFAQAVEIPLSNIRPNPKNPGPPITEEQIVEMVENLKEGGLLNPIKLMPDPEKGDGHWVILAGERRYRAFLRLKRETIPAILMYPTPAEAVRITRVDNAIRDRGWWADYQSIENLLEADPSLNQRQIGTYLQIALPRVNRALGLLPLLNPSARALLVTDGNNGNKGNKGISELAAAGLAGLATDPVTPETQDLVRRALAEAIHQDLTQMGVRGLVQWIKQGNRPEASGTRPAVKVSPSSKAAPTPKPTPVSTLTPAPEPKSAQPPSDGLKELVMGGTGGILIGFLASNLKRALGILTRRWMMHGIVGLGAVALFLTHGLDGLFKVHPKTSEAQASVPAPTQAVPEPQAPQKVAPISKTPRKVGKGLHLHTAPQGGGQALVVPSQGADGNGGAKGGSVPKWAPEGLPLVKDFTARFYNRSYSTWDDDQTYLKARMTEDYAPAFLKQYYPPAQRAELLAKQEFQYYSEAKGPVVIGGQGNSAQYRVQGQITLQNRSGRNPKNVWTKPVALEISLRHGDGMGCWVEKVTEIAPLPIGAQAENHVDPLKGVQDVAGEVSNVADSVSKVGNARKLLGL